MREFSTTKPTVQQMLKEILWTGNTKRLERKWQPTPVFLPGQFQGQWSLAGYHPWDHKELDLTEHGTAEQVV